MNSEILSIDTITKMVQLEAENKELKETLVKVIDDANTYMFRVKSALEYINNIYYEFDENDINYINSLSGILDGSSIYKKGVFQVCDLYENR